MRADDWEALRRTIYGEARGESYEGQIGVAWVIKNRADNPRWWGRSIEEVCHYPKQFSCWNEGDPNLAVIHAASENVPAFLRASGIAALVMLGHIPDPTMGATHYHTLVAPAWVQNWPPSWVRSLVETVQIGAHVFYREAA